MDRTRLTGSVFWTAALATALLTWAFVGPSVAQVPSAVQDAEFQQHCAACHGSDGRGGGPVAEAMGVTLPSLTGLARRNGGKFPFERVYRTIDGTFPVKAHGTLEMPLWGQRYRVGLETYEAPSPDRDRSEYRIVHGRILELVYFLATIQEE